VAFYRRKKGKSENFGRGWVRVEETSDVREERLQCFLFHIPLIEGGKGKTTKKGAGERVENSEKRRGKGADRNILLCRPLLASCLQLGERERKGEKAPPSSQSVLSLSRRGQGE